MYDYAWLQYGRTITSTVEHNVTGANFCTDAYLIVLVVRHLSTILSTQRSSCIFKLQL